METVMIIIVIMDFLGVLLQDLVRIAVVLKFKVRMVYIFAIAIRHVLNLEIVVMISLSTADIIAMVKN